ncbi:unnamed protein product, partial [Strongylus vulgaris]
AGAEPTASRGPPRPAVYAVRSGQTGSGSARSTYMDRKFKLAVISRVERHPEIWDFTSEDYKKQDVRLTAWDQIVSELQAEGFNTGIKHLLTISG